MTFDHYIPAIAIVIFCIIISLNVISSSIYDIKQSRRFKIIRTISRKNSLQPEVTIIILCRNNQSTIIDTIKSISKGGIKKMQIVIVDNLSTDNSKRIIRSHLKKNPRKNIRLVARRSYDPSLESNITRWKKYANTEIVYLIRGNQYVEAGGLKKLRDYFSYDDSVNFVEPICVADFEPSLTSMYKNISNIFYEHARKSFIPRLQSNYRSSYMIRRTPKHIEDYNVSYVSQVRISESGEQPSATIQLTHPAQLVFNWTVLALFLASFATSTPLLFLIGWVAAMTQYLVTLLTSSISSRNQIRLAIYAPVIYLYCMFAAFFGMYFLVQNIQPKTANVFSKP